MEAFNNSWKPLTTHTLFLQTNVVVPVICEMVNDIESHPTEHGKQISLYVKITIFRWFNSAIALSLISTFVESISIEDGQESTHQSLIYKVYPVIVAELFVKPIYDMTDPLSNFNKHILAPRAQYQEEMNAFFSGTRFWLAERYTVRSRGRKPCTLASSFCRGSPFSWLVLFAKDANKVLFVALYFSAILPEAFLLAASALLVQFCVSKFMLLRLCGYTPDVGFYLSRLSRNFFIPFVLVAHVVMSAYWWSGYPYDNVCANDNGGYSYCNQNFWSAGVFPPLPKFQPEDTRWMSESQALLTSLYSWASVVVLFLAFVAFLRNILIPRIQAIYESTYEVGIEKTFTIVGEIFCLPVSFPLLLPARRC